MEPFSPKSHIFIATGKAFTHCFYVTEAAAGVDTSGPASALGVTQATERFHGDMYTETQVWAKH